MNCTCGHPYDEHDITPAPNRQVRSVCKHCTCTALLPINPTYRPPPPQQPTWIVRVPCSVRAGADNDADQGIGEVRGDAIVLRVRAANASDAVTKVINAIVWAYGMTEPSGSISHAERPRDEAIAEHARTIGLESIDPASVPQLGRPETRPCATSGCALHAVERVPLCAGHAAEARASKVPA